MLFRHRQIDFGLIEKNLACQQDIQTGVGESNFQRFCNLYSKSSRFDG